MICHTFETDRFPAEARQAIFAALSEEYELKKLVQTKDTLSFQARYQAPFVRNSGLPYVSMHFEETADGTRIHSIFSLDPIERIIMNIIIVFAAAISVAMSVMLLWQELRSPLYLLLPAGFVLLSHFLAYGLLHLTTRTIIRTVSASL